MKSEFVLAYCTFPDADTAEHICEQLVMESTIACANIFPAHRALYRWKEQMHRDLEVGAILKTTSGKQATLKARFKALHPYETPCLIFLSIDDGLSDFLSWIYTQSL